MLSRLRHSKINKFVTRSVFGELELTQISLKFKASFCNLKIRFLGAKLCVVFSIILILKGIMRFQSQSPCILLNININFNKNEMELKKENPIHSFRETNLVLYLI